MFRTSDWWRRFPRGDLAPAHATYGTRRVIEFTVWKDTQKGVKTPQTTMRACGRDYTDKEVEGVFPVKVVQVATHAQICATTAQGRQVV